MRSIARLTLAFATALATLFAFPALSQDLPNRVGRIAFIEGTASIYQDPDEGWEKAYVNAPVTAENSMWTDPGSRAELRVGGTAMRLDEGTQLDISRLDDDQLDAFVPRGTVSVRVRHYESTERVTLNTPHARFSIRANGRYRIDVDPDREESRLTVFAGDARVGSDGGRIRVPAGKTVRVFGGSAPSYVVENAFSDPFDRWADSRDAGWVESRSVKYVSSSMTGYEDLDRYGSWREEPEFGALWYPTRVANDWAPYRNGRWDYVRPWGWTWIDDAPWGYAPFHYGRWVYARDRWAWSPGKREVRPTWAPALVAWVGGSNFSVGVSGSSPSVGWYPLSPWERYQPWYQASPTYINQVNIVVRASPQREDRRQWGAMTRERGVTVVNRDVVVDRRPVQQSLVAVRPEVARQVQIAAPSIVLPSRNEVIQRRQTVRTQAAAPATAPATKPGSAPATQRPGTAQTPPPKRGEPAGPLGRPEFQRRQAAAPPAPEPAKAAPPPAQRVGPPTGAAQPQAREEMLKAREAAVLKSREDQKAREGEAKGRQDQKGAREAEQQKAREQQQQKAGEEQVKARAEQQKAREQQQKGRDDQQKAREGEQQKAQQQRLGEEQLKARAEQQKAAEEQRKAREQQQLKAGEGQMKARAEQQKAAEEQRKAREAQQGQQRQQQQQAQEAAKQAQEAAKQQQLQRAPPAPAGSPPPPDRAQQQRQEREKKAREDKDKKDKEDDEKKGKLGR